MSIQSIEHHPKRHNARVLAEAEIAAYIHSTPAARRTAERMIDRLGRAIELASPVTRLFDGIAMQHAPGILVLMGRESEARELAVLVAIIEAEEPNELTEEALSLRALAMLPDELDGYAVRRAAE